jgi:hypothetical protein
MRRQYYKTYLIKHVYLYEAIIMSEISKLWIILQFKPNGHRLAERNLIQNGYETFLPFEQVTKYRNRKLTLAYRPLFPGYMFWQLREKMCPGKR